ncbi:MAG: M24 family metallopeptidase [Fusicatenibacter sp.]
MKKLRVEKVLQGMERKGLSQMIVSDPYSVYYLTGRWIFPGERLLALLLGTDGKHHLVLSNLYPQPEDSDLEVTYVDDIQDCIAALAVYVKKGTVIGVDKNWQAKFLLRMLELNPTNTFVNASAIVDDVRMIKDEEEQELMRSSSLLNDKAVERLTAIAARGYDEQQLSDELLKIYKELGAEGFSFEPIIAFGRNTADPHYMPQHAKAVRGDCMTFDIGGKKADYCSDMTRDVFLGTVSDRQREIYEIVLEANLRGIAAAKPGNRMCDVDLAARRYIESKGFGEYFPHRTGHSIGLEVHEFGNVAYNNESIIRPGQCFSVEPGIYLPEEGFGIRIEDLVLITEHGCEVLNHYTKDLIVIPFE